MEVDIKIKIKHGDQELTLNRTEAKNLYYELRGLFGDGYVAPIYPIICPSIPAMPPIISTEHTITV